MQFHRLRLDRMCKEKAEKLGEAIGRVIEVDGLDNGQSARKKFFRVRVAFNIDSPLVEGIWINGEGDYDWAVCKHERLGDFCYYCGRLDRTSVKCKAGLIESGEASVEPWMKASTVSRNTNTINRNDTFKSRSWEHVNFKG